MRVEHIGDAVLYLGDALEILPTLPKVDAVVTDPPYGIGKRMQGGTWGAAAKYADFRTWDTAVKDLSPVLTAGNRVVLWGGNYYALPPSRCWLAWAKINAVPTMADFELAWTNLDKPCKQYRGQVGVHAHGHPTEKPIALMRWCIEQVGNPQTILDPFMGSGTTGVACAQLGRKFIGIEIHEPYFDIACRRIEQAYAQGKLFEPDQRKPTQDALL